MPLICPKCSHARLPNETAPDWQCPACGVAYVKAAAATQPIERTRKSYQPVLESEQSAIPWIKLVVFVSFAAVVGFSLQANRHKAARAPASHLDVTASNPSAADMGKLASSVSPGEVVMYSTTECGYCTQAKHWLVRNGFAFTECNMSVDERCEDEFRSFGGNGTPFLVITRGGKTYRMKNGFNSDEFLAILAI